MSIESLAGLNYDNSFVRELPADPEAGNFTRHVHGACYSSVLPEPVSGPTTLAVSREVLQLLEIDPETARSAAFAEVFGGNRVVTGMQPYAACYGGHQFGHWAGQLGDGRAITLGEMVNGNGERWEMQLKGAGPTPYSRMADGRAVMRSSVREFLCSEAMHHLGVPTTRALSLVQTGDQVVRDMFYDGNPRPEPGAVVCRVAPSFLRFGSYELLASRGDQALLRRLADYTIAHHFPELGPPAPATYLAWFEEVARRTALLLVEWMRVGFVHGVMNTDNMSILGLTIDYGPYGWIDHFDPNWTPNTTDAQQRRYRFGGQPNVAGWNLSMLANALLPLVDRREPLQAALETYPEIFNREYRAMMARKLGLERFDPAQDEWLIQELFELLQQVETDMTIFFRRLADLPQRERLVEAYYDPDARTDDHRRRLDHWLERYLARLDQEGRPGEQRREEMNRVNPRFVLRNYVAQLAIDRAEQGDGALVEELLDVMRRPYDEQPERERFAEKRPEWARHRAGCSMLS